VPGRFRWAAALIDLLIWLAATGIAAAIGGDRPADPAGALAVVVTGLALGALHLVVGGFLSLYGRRLERGGSAELTVLAVAAVVASVVVGAAAFLVGPRFGVSAVTVGIALPVALVLLGAVRLVQRYRSEVMPAGAGVQPTIVFGAGWLGRNLVRVTRTDHTSPYRPVAFLDDDPGKISTRVDGVPVLGTSADLASIVERTGATAIIVSIARADGALLRRISDSARELGLRVLVFPSLAEVLDGKSRLRDVRDIGIEDLIGRQPIDTDVESMAGYLRGKRVLVTGAGGSIGSELSRQISQFGPKSLVMLDRDESALQDTQILLEGHGLLMNDNIVLADIRDETAVREIFASRRPDVVFHAAALKHLPMLERFPDEAWKTNVLGTRNVLEAARAVGVETFVNVSTDKAANPTSVLGHSKRLAERLTSGVAAQTGWRYLSVRFGNVLGSRGSLVPVFAAMIEAGGPLTVTDREVTRFFMSIPEACHLVLQAGGIGGPGEVLILDMGEPVRIIDIAERMIAQSGRDIGIVVTGLREGEKLHEELFGDGESTERPVHPKISHSTVPPLDAGMLDREDWQRSVGSVSS
jgi:dTDP-glucose 4,6-dehydratase